MKKKILTILLIFMLLPTVFMFSSCKTGDYKLSSLKDDYTNIYNYETIKLENEKFTINYSSYEVFNSATMQNKPYSYLNNYNNTLKCTMIFADSYLTQISKGGYKVDAKVRVRLKNELEDLDKAFTKLDVNAQKCAEYVEFSSDLESAHSKQSLEALLCTYEEAYQAAFNFNSTLMEIYFSNVKIKDFTEQEEFVPLVAVADMRLEARIKQHVVYNAMCFAEKKLCSDEFINSFVENPDVFAPVENVYSNYDQAIKVINIELNEQVLEEISNNVERLNRFKNSLITLNNLQLVINNDYKYFKNACKEINYIEVDAEFVNASNNEKTKLRLINNFSSLLTQYNQTLATLGV